MKTTSNKPNAAAHLPLPDDAIELVRTYAQRLVRFAHQAHVIATTLTQLVSDIATGIALEDLQQQAALIPKHCALMLKTLSRAYRRTLSELLADAHVPDDIQRRARSRRQGKPQ